jgi:predicted phosphoribosyltransferase
VNRLSRWPPPFRDRRDAGAKLAAALDAWAGQRDVIVLALPRGGVPVAFEIAERLDAPLDVCLVRKLGVPGHPELAMGALAADGVEVLNQDLIAELSVPPALIERTIADERMELARRERAYRPAADPLVVRGLTVIVVDDGLATGASMEAAVTALRRMAPARIVVAVPVGAPDTCARLRATADDVVCLAAPDDFRAVGLWYLDFSQTGDDEVRRLLEERRRHGAGRR